MEILAKQINIENVRKDFPILTRLVHNRPLIYLDSCATSQKPSVVVNSIKSFYENNNANIHR